MNPTSWSHEVTVLPLQLRFQVSNLADNFSGRGLWRQVFSTPRGNFFDVRTFLCYRSPLSSGRSFNNEALWKRKPSIRMRANTFEEKAAVVGTRPQIRYRVAARNLAQLFNLKRRRKMKQKRINITNLF